MRASLSGPLPLPLPLSFPRLASFTSIAAMRSSIAFPTE